MRACLSGHRELALKLYNRNPKALKIVNDNGENCLTIAKSSGHPDIATVLECKAAVRELRANDIPVSFKKEETKDRFPKGCYKDTTNNVYFNQISSEQSRSNINAIPICKLVSK